MPSWRGSERSGRPPNGDVIKLGELNGSGLFDSATMSMVTPAGASRDPALFSPFVTGTEEAPAVPIASLEDDRDLTARSLANLYLHAVGSTIGPYQDASCTRRRPQQNVTHLKRGADRPPTMRTVTPPGQPAAMTRRRHSPMRSERRQGRPLVSRSAKSQLATCAPWRRWRCDGCVPVMPRPARGTSATAHCRADSAATAMQTG
jgi:hypothetical protein